MSRRTPRDRKLEISQNLAVKTPSVSLAIPITSSSSGYLHAINFYSLSSSLERVACLDPYLYKLYNNNNSPPPSAAGGASQWSSSSEAARRLAKWDLCRCSKQHDWKNVSSFFSSRDDLWSWALICVKSPVFSTHMLCQNTPNPPDAWFAKLPEMSSRMEESLFRSASSFKEYSDNNTLRQRDCDNWRGLWRGGGTETSNRVDRTGVMAVLKILWNLIRRSGLENSNRINNTRVIKVLQTR